MKQVIAVIETPEQEIARLRAENSRLKNKASNGMRVSSKGAMSLYGLGRFPVTLYKSQWQELIKSIPEIVEFLAQHDHELKSKPTAATASVEDDVEIA